MPHIPNFFTKYKKEQYLCYGQISTFKGSHIEEQCLILENIVIKNTNVIFLPLSNEGAFNISL